MDHTDDLRERVEALEHHTHRVERRLRWWRGIACTVVVFALLSWALPSSVAKDAKPQGAKGLEERVEVLEAKLEHVTSGPDEVTITGANLRIVNGLGDTETTNGLGNLIVGYNESRASFIIGELGQFLLPNCETSPLDPACADTRTGSHNIVAGKGHNFSSFGGLVVGMFNDISGPFASVSGGVVNHASGLNSSVGGGGQNKASGVTSSIGGGAGGTASGLNSSVSGGDNNTASGVDSWVGGGDLNIASGAISAVCGGISNKASGEGAAVSGGQENTAGGRFASVSGGLKRTAPGENNWAAGPLFADF